MWMRVHDCTYGEEAVEVWKVKSMRDLSKNIQSQLPLIG